MYHQQHEYRLIRRRTGSLPHRRVDLHAGGEREGIANLTLELRDNGGTVDGGVDTSGTQTFTITVTAVDDPPVFTAGATLAYTNGDGTSSTER